MTVWPVYRRTTSRDSSKSGSYVYLWADAVYFNVRLQKDRPCVLVVVGATEDGHKELLAIQDGERESHLSWLHLLQDLKARGLKEHSFLAVADGASGFWKALEEALPGARAQQCWVHKTANVLDKLSQRVRLDAKSLLHEMYLAPYDRFLGRYQDKYPQACECLRQDRDEMFAFYDFPGRPLGAPTNDQPDRIDLRHGAPSHAPDQSLWLTRHGFDHGLQTGNPGRKALASSQQLSTHHPSRRWRHLHRR